MALNYAVNVTVFSDCCTFQSCKKILSPVWPWRKKITFNRSRDPLYFKTVLKKEYPQLDEVGGYELMRTEDGSRRELVIIPPPVSGYSSGYLAESFLGQALCYIRPVQKNFLLENPQVEFHLTQN